MLDHKGTISHQQAIERAKKEYNEFNKTQKIESDFDRFAKHILDKKRWLEIDCYSNKIKMLKLELSRYGIEDLTIKKGWKYFQGLKIY